MSLIRRWRIAGLAPAARTVLGRGAIRGSVAKTWPWRPPQGRAEAVAGGPLGTGAVHLQSDLRVLVCEAGPPPTPCRPSRDRHTCSSPGGVPFRPRLSPRSGPAVAPCCGVSPAWGRVWSPVSSPFHLLRPRRWSRGLAVRPSPNPPPTAGFAFSVCRIGPQDRVAFRHGLSEVL